MSMQHIRSEFPIFDDEGLVYLDNASTTQKPRAVVQAITDFYAKGNANIARGVYPLSEQATLSYELSRKKLAQFVNAKNASDVVFVRGTTEGMNLLAATWGPVHIGKGDVIVLSIMEHHSNWVPWQVLAEKVGAVVRVVPLNAWELDLEAYEASLEGSKLVALTHVSNTLGTVNPIAKMVAMAKAKGACVVVDGAQAVVHMPVDMQALGCDFYVFSGHKLFGPTGIGVVCGTAQSWASLPPYQTGGGMIQRVTLERTTYQEGPARYEAGTPHIAGAIGLSAAVDFVKSWDWPTVMQHEDALLRAATEGLRTIAGVRIIGEAPHKAGVLSFTLEGVHPHDVAEVLAQSHVAIRAGHHCTQPLMRALGLVGTNRASFAIYNNMSDVQCFLEAVHRAKRLFS